MKLKIKFLKKKSKIINDIPKSLNDVNLNFYKLRGGSLGGKARGLAFLNSLLEQEKLRSKFKNIDINVPKCAIIGTNEFLKFMKHNNLWDKVANCDDEKIIKSLFIQASLSEKVKRRLNGYLNLNKVPIAVRSSSLLEDSQYKSLSGSFDTYMLTNNNSSHKIRFKELENAIKLVFSSIFKSAGKTLIKNTGHNIEEERMAVIIQHIAGRPFKNSNRFYPSFSGVIKGINYYPFSYMKRNEGIIYLALGFGRTIVEGEKCLAVSPKYPNILPQFYSPKSIEENTQNNFYALNLNLTNNLEKDLKNYSLEESEKDGSLRYIGSVLTKNDKQLRHSLAFEGTRAITFAHILKWKTFPLTAIATELLKLGKKSLGCEVEIEFSVNLYKDRKPNFNILQIKPMSNIMVDLENKSLEKDSIFSKSNHSLGNGFFNDLRDLIIVRDETFLITKSHEIAKEIASLNKGFSKSEHYIISGPGRWGSTDHWMGIPVTWDQISRAKVFIEVGRDDLPIEPSFGSHFFQNITSLNKGYFTIDQKSKSDFMNYEWLSENDIVKKYDYIDHYKFSEPLIVRIDGTSGLGIIQKPSNRYNQLMDESKSSGI